MMEYRMLRASDIPEAVEISKRQLGVDYLDEGDFEDAMSDPGQFCLVAADGDRVAGFSICQVFGPEGEREKLMLPDCPERDEVMSTPLTGLLDSVAVSADFKGRGIGTELGSRCIQEMKVRGCGIACAMAWKNIHGVTNIAKVLERLGLRETISIQGYWNQMVDSPDGHDCPICGAPCRCWGVFWYRTIRCGKMDARGVSASGHPSSRDPVHRRLHPVRYVVVHLPVPGLV